MSVTAPVFLSYSHKDRDFVDKLAKRLETASVAVWYDRNLVPGRPWSEELEEHIREARAVVVVLSPSSANSDYVRKEILCAQDSGKRIIPVMLNATKTPLPIIDLQWVDAQEGKDPLPGLLAALRGEDTPDLKPPEVLPETSEPLELRLSVQPAGEEFQASLRLEQENLDADSFTFSILPAA